MNPEDLKFLYGTSFLGIFLGILVLGLATAFFVCLFLSSCFQRIPEKFRVLSPGKVWFLLIPGFAFVWNFWIFPGLSRSFKAYFDSVGDPLVGDCSENIGVAYSVCSLVSLVPCVGFLSAPAALVLLIVYLIKAHDLRNRIPAS